MMIADINDLSNFLYISFDLPAHMVILLNKPAFSFQANTYLKMV